MLVAGSPTEVCNELPHLACISSADAAACLVATVHYQIHDVVDELESLESVPFSESSSQCNPQCCDRVIVRT